MFFVFGATSLLLSACGYRNPESFQSRTLTLMQDTYIADIENVSAFGLARVYNSPGRDTLIRLDEDGQLQEVVFLQEATDTTVAQESVGYIANFLVAEKFTFIQFSEFDTNQNFQANASFFINSSNVVIVIHHTSGRIFPLPEFQSISSSSFSIFNGLIHYTRPSDHVRLYYNLHVDQEYNLVITHIAMSPHLAIHHAGIDAFGNAIFITDTIASELTSTALFIRNEDDRQYFFGQSNIVYRMHNGIFEMFNQERQWIYAPDTLDYALYHDFQYHVWRDGIMHSLRYLSTGYTYYPQTGGKDIHTININSAFIVDDEVFVFTGYGLYHISLDQFIVPGFLRATYQVSGRNLHWINGEAIMETLGAEQTRQYRINFNGATATAEYIGTLTFNGRPLIIIAPIN